MMHYVKTLTIAGSDSGGGAGIQADIKTMSALGCYASSVVTAVTAQNTKQVFCIQNIEAAVVEAQLRAVLTDLRPDAIKIGMVGCAENIKTIAQVLAEYNDIPLVIDPVMVSTSGNKLMEEEAISTFCRHLLPMATVLTPNIAEAEVLAHRTITTVADIDEAAKQILKLGCKALLIKGGHIEGNEKTDRLYFSDKSKPLIFESETIDSSNTHGTGCTLSSAIASFLARGLRLEEAVAKAKNYISQAIRAGANVCIGGGHGAVNHFFCPEKLIKTMNNIQFITHENQRFDYVEGAEMALRGGCKWVQLRMKDATDNKFLSIGRKVATLCRSYNATFLLDDRVHLVAELGADGVHLGKNDMPISEARRILGNEKIIGGTANTFADVQHLAAQGADYIGCGPFRYTPTKRNLAPILSLEDYRNILKQMQQAGISLPLIAIGGIVSTDIAALRDIGVSGIAVSGAVLEAADPIKEMKKLIEI